MTVSYFFRSPRNQVGFIPDNIGTFDFTGGTVPLGVSFSRASAGTYNTATPLRTTAAVDEARFNHNPLTGSAIGLLYESAATNLATNSQALNTYVIANINSFGGSDTGTLNAGSFANTTRHTDAFGTNTSEFVQENTTAASVHNLRDATQFSIVSGTTYTVSVDVALGAGRSFIALSLASGPFGANLATYNLTNGTSVGTGAASASTTRFMEQLPNGIWRVYLKLTASSTASGSGFISIVDDTGNVTYTGDGTKGLFLGCVQIVAGTGISGAGGFSSSYIATGASTATRAADNATVSLPYSSNFLTYTFDDDSIQMFSSATNPYTIPTNLSRVNIKSLKALEQNNTQSYAVMSDSMGATPDAKNYLPAQLSQGYVPSRYVYAGGIVGETSTQVRTRYEALPDLYNKVLLAWCGRNNPAVPTTVINDINAMIALLTDANRYVVLSPCLTVTEFNAGSGTGYTQITALRAALSSQYGAHYLDVQDIVLANNYDGQHPNAAGVTLIRNRLITFLNGLGL